MHRYGSVVRLRPEHEEEYIRLHADVWPSVLERLTKSNITNYSIFLRDGLLFSYFEYVGDDYDADMAAMGTDPETQRWWELCVPFQERLSTAADAEQWAPAVEVFHID